ncbi:MAG TPA: DUF5615 family PIN-like protein [Bryobacteraceae bacterium]|nr:DUF5615 family PIN-like protein [Bryobacteraceae bacterium]
MIRVLLGQGLAPRTAEILRRHGLDAIHVSEIGLERAEDIHILEQARNDRVCVTLDHDFHAHQAGLIESVCTQCETALSEGAAVSADRKSIRIRRLPLR